MGTHVRDDGKDRFLICRGPGREPGRAPEDRHARQGQSLDGQRADRHLDLPQALPLLLEQASGLCSLELRPRLPQISRRRTPGRRGEGPRRAARPRERAPRAPQGPRDPPTGPARRRELDRQEPRRPASITSSRTGSGRSSGSSTDAARASRSATGYDEPLRRAGRQDGAGPRVRGIAPPARADRAVRRRAKSRRSWTNSRAPVTRRPRKRRRASTSSSSCFHVLDPDRFLEPDRQVRPVDLVAADGHRDDRRLALDARSLRQRLGTDLHGHDGALPLLRKAVLAGRPVLH